MKKTLIILGLGLLWLSGTADAAEIGPNPDLDEGQMVFPADDWAKASPESQRVDPEQLKAAVEYLDRSLGEHGGAGTVFMVRNGYVIWAGPDSDRQHQIYSATKSFTSTVLGLLIDDGKVTLSTLAKDLEPALADLYPAVTLRHFATMTSGYDSIGGSYEFDIQGRGDSWNPGPPGPPIFPPGTKFRYWDDAMMQFGNVLTKAAGEPLDRLFKTRIADPIGMTQWRWTENDSATGPVLSWTGGVHTSSQELARLGHLFLNGGNWNGRQLVSASWIAQATVVQVPATIPNDGLPRSRGAGVYGYNWWVNGFKPDGKRLWPAAPPATFYANGLHNNVCIVVPEWNMVIARTNAGRQDGSANTPTNVNEIWSEFFGRLAQAIAPPKAGIGEPHIQLKDHSFEDENGPFLALGVSYFQALRHAKYDRARLNSNLALFASKGFNYVRILSMVSWDGLEIAPVEFTNRSGRVLPAWPDYWEQFRDLLDLAAQHGLRVEVTIFADAQYVMPDQATRQTHLERVLENIAGHESHILHLEVANEAWQNGFSEAQGVTDLRTFTQYLTDRTNVPVAITSNADTSDQGIISLYRDSAADLATVHFSRDIHGVEGGWLPVRDAYRAGNLPGVPPVSSNEPIGPGSSVNAESDPIKLCAAAAFAYISNLPAYVYHSRAGVFGYVRCCPPAGDEERFENSAGIHAYQFLGQILPPDLANWVRNDGLEPSAPLTVFCNNQPNRYWPDESRPTDGCDRNIGSVKENEFVCLPMGILRDGVTLQARRPVRFQVFNPLTGEVVSHLTLSAGDRCTLPQGPGAYICKGTFTGVDPPRIRSH